MVTILHALGYSRLQKIGTKMDTNSLRAMNRTTTNGSTGRWSFSSTRRGLRFYRSTQSTGSLMVDCCYFRLKQDLQDFGICVIMYGNGSLVIVEIGKPNLPEECVSPI